MPSENKSTQNVNEVTMLDIQAMLGDKDITILNLLKRIQSLEAEIKEKLDTIDRLSGDSEAE